MSMNFRTKNGFRDLQVILKELGLYCGAIDGAWGSGTASSTVVLLRAYADQMGRGPLDVASLPSKAGENGDLAIKPLQGFLASMGLYSGSVDGLWGNGTFGGILKTRDLYVSKHKAPTYGLCWSKKVPAEFARMVLEECLRRKWPEAAAHWLMACMAFETGGTFSPSIQNGAGAQAFGLIQFMKGAATDLKVPLEQIKAMRQLEQLALVFKYFDFWAKAGKRFTQLEDFYLTIFYPKAVGMKADQTLFDSKAPAYLKAYTQNKGFDLNKDGLITVGEISSKLYDVYYSGMDPVNRTQAA